MSGLPFEATFRSWCESASVDWATMRYPRPEAGGETRAHRLRPAGEVRGGVLVVHGAGNDALFSLTGTFAALLGAGLEIFTFDVDGHGRGGDTRLSAEGVASAVPAALEAWGGPIGGGPVHGFGISLGGALLLQALAGLGSAIESATIACTPLRVELSWRSVLGEVGTPMVRTVVRGRRWFGLTGLIPSFGPFGRGNYPLRLAEAPGPGPFGYVPVLNRILDRLDLLGAASRVHIPVHVVHGGRDRLVPIEQARRIAAALPSGELLVLPKETHLTAPLSPTTQQLLLRRTGAEPTDGAER